MGSPSAHLLDGVHANAHDLRVGRAVLVEVLLETLHARDSVNTGGEARARTKHNITNQSVTGMLEKQNGSRDLDEGNGLVYERMPVLVKHFHEACAH